MTWDILASIVLVIACFMTPYGLAFEDLDACNVVRENGIEGEECQVFYFNDSWNVIDSIIDIAFLIEIIICFNTSYFDEEKNEFVTNRCKVAKSYTCGGWFWIDLVAVIPRFMRIFENQEGNIIVKTLSFLKIARIGRLIKLLKLLKMAKVVKEKEKIQKHMHAKMRLNVAKERLLIFSIFAILFVHTISCLWIFLGNMNHKEGSEPNWIDAFEFGEED